LSEGSNKSGYLVSGAMHGALLWLLVFSLARAPKFEDQPESIPVDTLTQDQFNQIMKGERDAPPAKAPVEPPPRPVSAEPPPAPPPPVAPSEIKHAEETPAPPPKPAAEVSPEPPVKPKPVQMPPEKPKDPPPEKPKAEATPKPPAKEKIVDAQKPPAKPPKSFDLTAIAKLVKTADATPTGATIQGLLDQHAERMSPSLLAALDSWLRETYTNCWSAPPGIPEGEPYVAAVRVEYNSDGSLSGQPRLVNPPQNAAWRPHAESAVRATLKCNPLHVPAQFAPYYEQWKIKTIHFDPRDALD
jgi:outer membrane biosynthesis protein TonB